MNTYQTTIHPSIKPAFISNLTPFTSTLTLFESSVDLNTHSFGLYKDIRVAKENREKMQTPHTKVQETENRVLSFWEVRVPTTCPKPQRYRG